MLTRSRLFGVPAHSCSPRLYVLNPAGELEYWAFRDAAVRVFRMIGGNFAIPSIVLVDFEIDHAPFRAQRPDDRAQLIVQWVGLVAPE